MAEHLAIDIDGGHLFRYPSEVDPRKKATKVSYHNTCTSSLSDTEQSNTNIIKLYNN